jgi:hypothetical protein
MASTFTVGATVSTFEALQTQFSQGGGPLEEIRVSLHVASAAEWGALFGLRSWLVNVRPVPGGSTVVVDIGAGEGEGTLAIEGLDSHTAVLTDISSGPPIGAGEDRIVNATFLVTA